MDYKGERPRQLALAATIEEVKRFEAVKRYHKRSSDSDTLRFLIDQEAEKILSKNVPVGIDGGAK